MKSWTSRSADRIAGDFELSADSRLPLPRARQSPVAIEAGMEHLRLDSASIVPDPHAEVSACIFQFELDVLGPPNDKTR
jgi:hypothetical protein